MKRNIGLAFLILIFFSISGCDVNKEPYVYPTEYDFEYQVTGTASRANIIYQDLRGNYIEKTNAALPWNYQTHYYDNQAGVTPVYLSAQSLDSAPASVTVTINAKGALYKQATLSGDYVFVAVYGTLP